VGRLESQRRCVSSEHLTDAARALVYLRLVCRGGPGMDKEAAMTAYVTELEGQKAKYS
jgi:hypothetical protein